MSDLDDNFPIPSASPGTYQVRASESRYEPEEGFWHRVGNIGRSIGQAAKKALPYLAEMDVSSASFGSISGDWGTSDNATIYEPTSSRRSTPRYRGSTRSVFSQGSPDSNPLMATRFQPKNAPPSAIKMSQLQANSRRILNKMASAKGLPSYEEFHREHGVVYDPPSQKSGLGIKTYLKEQASRQSAHFIRESNPEPVPKAQTPRRAPQPSDVSRFQSAEEILADFLHAMPTRRLPKAEYQNRDEDRKQDLWPKLQAGQALNDNEMKQLFLTLDIQHYQAQTEKQKLEAELLRHYAEQKLAENLVKQASRNAEGLVLIGGVPVRAEDALYFAKQDIQHFRETDAHLRPDQIKALNTQNDIPNEPGAPDVTAEAVFNLVSVGQLLRSVGTAALSKLASDYIARQAAKRIIYHSEQQLAKVYMRHGKDLNVIGNYSSANAQRLAEIIANHVRNPNTIMIKGTYRGTQRAIHYYNSNTGVLVISKPNGQLWSAWKISKDQIKNLYKTGNIQ